MQLPSFLVYLAIHGVTGIADHSGINVDIPFFYRSKFHDDHHKLFNCNFGFPFAFLDHLYGTFRESD
jgi:sterol desaturase/sphingolipid hydroxylase (fatty acid hydroxylase superfamily)